MTFAFAFLMCLLICLTPVRCASGAESDLRAGADALTAEFEGLFAKEGSLSSSYAFTHYVDTTMGSRYRNSFNTLNSKGETPLTCLISLARDTLPVRANSEVESGTLRIIDTLTYSRTLPRPGINIPNARGLTPLMCIIYSADIKRVRPESASRIAKYLIERGADPEMPDHDGENTVSKALRAPIPNRKTLELLLALDLRQPGSLRAKDGQTALTLSWLAPELLEKFLSEEKWGWTRKEKDDGLLASSAETWLDTERVRLFLKTGADVNIRDATGKNLLAKYLSEGETWKTVTSKTLAELIGLGLDIGARTRGGETLLTINNPFVLQPPKYLELLLKAGSNVSDRDERGRTPTPPTGTDELPCSLRKRGIPSRCFCRRASTSTTGTQTATRPSWPGCGRTATSTAYGCC